MMSDTNKRTALITGATSGIGKAFAERFAKAGLNLVITGRRKEIIQRLADDLYKKQCVRVDVVIAELSSQSDLDRLVQKAEETENLEILVNNAGFATRGKFFENDFKNQEKMIRVHVIATMILTHTIIPKMLEKGKGIIINVSSMGAFAFGPHNTTYCGTKAFINLFTESLHLELLGSGIRVQVLCPGFVKTDFHEKMDFDLAKLQKNRGLIKWMTSEEIVAASIRDLERGRVLCIPGKSNQIIYLASRFLPRSKFYRMLLNNLKKLATNNL